MKVKDESETAFKKAWGSGRWGKAFDAAIRVAIFLFWPSPDHFSGRPPAGLRQNSGNFALFSEDLCQKSGVLPLFDPSGGRLRRLESGQPLRQGRNRRKSPPGAALGIAAAQRELDELCGFSKPGSMTREESSALLRAAAAALLGDRLDVACALLDRVKKLSGLTEDAVMELMEQDASSLADFRGGPRPKLAFAVRYVLAQEPRWLTNVANL